MGITEAVRTLTQIANGASAVQQIHQTGKYMHSEVVKATNNIVRMPLTINAPASVRVNQPVTIEGTGVGMISLYSAEKLERELFADKTGHWYIRLYFSVPGTYDMRVTDYYSEATATLVAD